MILAADQNGEATVTATKPGPEHQIEAAAATGDLVDLRTGTPQHDDPANGVDWDAARTVGAGLLASLLTASGKPDASRHRAIKIRGARITGSLDLQGLILACPLLLQDCHIDQPVDLSDSTAPSISLSGCHVPALAAGHLSTSGNLRLSDGFTAHNWVDLTYARIGGLLDFCKARLDGGLWASGLTVGQSLDCRNFSVTGSMNLTSASIRLQVNLGGATLDNPGGRALDAGGLSVGAGLLCRKAQDTGTRFTARGEVFLTRSRIGSQLDLSGAVLANERGQALTATGVTAEGGMVCGEEFTARGEVNLAGAR